MSPRQLVNLVPHTHWDREWYEPFQSFRLRLVDVVDGLLDLMESDESYEKFLLDGQMAVVDDYLEIRPENEKRLRALTESGRVSCGPWYILMDEFLVSGETIVRNLQMGFRRAADFGGAMEVGYLPDMFGHIAQMPQILRHAGLEQAVVWRGVPSAIDRSAFWWSAPDGSRVRAQYLVTGYGEGSGIADDPQQLARRVSAYVDREKSFLSGPILIMNGNDHEPPQPWLGQVVAAANEIQDDYEFVIASLTDALSTTSGDDLPSWTGELRSGARANLLMGVASNHVDVRQAAAVCERSLERLAEPLATLFLPEAIYPTALFDVAWREVVRNSAHDSICACSDDEVVRAVLNRFADARQIAQGVRDKALLHLASSFAEPAHMILNPAARPRGGVVELVLAGSEDGEGEQSVSSQAGLDAELVLSVEQVRGVLGQIDNDQIGRDAYVTNVEVTDVAPSSADVSGTEDPIVLDIAVSIGPERRQDLSLDSIRRDLEARLALWQGGRVRARLAHTASRRVLARVNDVPGLGWKPYRPQPLEHPVGVETDTGGAISLQNGLVQVLIDPDDGTMSVDGAAGMNMLVDSGDQGDTYNYSPPAQDLVVDAPERTELSIHEEGPVRAVVKVRRIYRWPERVDDGTLARVGETEVVVESEIELRAGERFVRVRTSLENPCRDHRLRALFPLPTRASSSRAECAFGTVERGLTAEGGPSERALPTYPARRFVQAGDLTICQDGLIEYELVDITTAADGQEPAAGAIAITLLRSTGYLSRLTMVNRPLPAGPNIPLESSQMIGPVEVRYCVATGDVDPYAFADDAFLPLITVPTLGGGQRPSEGSALGVHGAEVSALRRTADGVAELRLFNPTGVEAGVTVAWGDSLAHGHLVDLRGREIERFEGSMSLAPWRIATIRLVEG
jgi:alpha-mannosidase